MTFRETYFPEFGAEILVLKLMSKSSPTLHRLRPPSVDLRADTDEHFRENSHIHKLELLDPSERNDFRPKEKRAELHIRREAT